MLVAHRFGEGKPARKPCALCIRASAELDRAPRNAPLAPCPTCESTSDPGEVSSAARFVVPGDTVSPPAAACTVVRVLNPFVPPPTGLVSLTDCCLPLNGKEPVLPTRLFDAAATRSAAWRVEAMAVVVVRLVVGGAARGPGSSRPRAAATASAWVDEARGPGMLPREGTRSGSRSDWTNDGSSINGDSSRSVITCLATRPFWSR
mmetsp:Transcript_4867/g.9545  ORF Transcript_4867/g.9545 Transcript_4867/m.9545 type:complete len:205 (+) Transcript_4867:637-1251(+)